MISILLIASIFGYGFCQESRQVTTLYGDVRGYLASNGEYYEFLGIPYATPPIGENRFKNPQPPQPWSGVFEANAVPRMCPQVTVFATTQEQSEDCLNVNVYVPLAASPSNPLPVLFFVHGGGFNFGSGYGYNAWHTVRHEVILVTFNYRLNVPGLLCLGTERIPGNAALKDQVSALRWVHNNIANFGGDPASITIYGESAGGVSVEHLTLTPTTNGLIRRAIIESGSSLASWALTYNRIGTAKSLAMTMGFSYPDNYDELEDFLINAPISDLIQTMGMVRSADLGPCVENSIEGVEAFFTDYPTRILTTENYESMQVMYAYTEMEGKTFLGQFLFDGAFEAMENNFYTYLGKEFKFDDIQSSNEVSETMKRLYFGESTISDQQIKEIVDFSSDQTFVVGMIRSALLRSSSSDNAIYVMEFSYKGGFNQPNAWETIYPELNAAGHADIVAHVMDLGHSNNETIAQDQIIRDRMTEMWTNFVKYGDPTPQTSVLLPTRWLPFTGNEQNYLKMTDTMTMFQVPREGRVEVWNEIYEKYYRAPPLFPTSHGSKFMPSILFYVISLISFSLYF